MLDWTEHCGMIPLRQIRVILSAIKFVADWRVRAGLGCCVVARCNCHIPDTPLRIYSRNTSNFFSTIMLVAVNVAVNTPEHSFPTEISAPDWRWGKRCAVFSLVDNKCLRLSSSLWVACMRLTSGRINCSPCCILTLLTEFTFLLFQLKFLS